MSALQAKFRTYPLLPGSSRLGRAVCFFTFIAFGCLLPHRVDAQSRRPGLDGKFTSRHITIARNSLMVISGPLSPAMFGQRISNQVYDGGLGYTHPSLSGSATGAPQQNSLAYMGGVAFGLFDTFEAGALFLPIQLTPNVKYGDVPVFLTYARRFGNVDIGAKINVYMPTSSPSFRLNPGLPVSWHTDAIRLDSGVYIPIDFSGSTTAGVNIPIRFSWNIKPKIFVGLETAFFDPALSQGKNLTMPLGAFAGYTAVLGSKLVDIGTFFMWDNFLRLNPPAGINTLQPSNYRVLLGLNYRTMVL